MEAHWEGKASVTETWRDFFFFFFCFEVFVGLGKFQANLFSCLHPKCFDVIPSTLMDLHGDEG